MPAKKNGVLLGALAAAFFASLAIDPGWIYNLIGIPDEWAYFGAILHPAHMRAVYPAHPLGDLVSAIVPPSVFYHLFSPVWANLLFKMTRFVLTGWVMFRILEMEFGERTAVFGTLAFLSNKYLLFAFANDYPQGMVILYQLPAIYFTLKAADERERRRPGLLFFAGFFYSMSAAAALLSVVYGAALAVLYLGKLHRPKAGLPRGLGRDALLFAAGAVSGIAALGLVHYGYAGRFVFFSNTFRKAQSFLQHAPHPGRFSPTFSWLDVPACTLLAAAALGAHRLWKPDSSPSSMRNRARVPVLAAAAAYAALLYVQVVRKTGTISDSYYFNQTLPFTFIAMAGVFFGPAEELSPRSFAAAAAAFAAASLALFGLVTHSSGWGRLFALNPINALVVPVLFFLLVHYDRKVLSVCAASIFYLVVNFCPPVTSSLRADARTSDLIPSRKLSLEAAADWVRLMDRVDPRREAYLWYDKLWDGKSAGIPRRYDQSGDGNHWVSLAASSHYWQGRIFNEAFPQAAVSMGEVGIVGPELLAGKRLLLMAPDEPQVRLAEANLRSINLSAACGKVQDFISQNRKLFEIYSCGPLEYTSPPASAAPAPDPNLIVW